MESFTSKEWNDLYRIYLAAQELMLNPKMVDVFNMNENTRFETDMRMVLIMLKEYNQKFNTDCYATRQVWPQVLETYGFLKNENSVSLHDDK